MDIHTSYYFTLIGDKAPPATRDSHEVGPFLSVGIKIKDEAMDFAPLTGKGVRASTTIQHALACNTNYRSNIIRHVLRVFTPQNGVSQVPTRAIPTSQSPPIDIIIIDYLGCWRRQYGFNRTSHAKRLPLA